MDDLYSSKSVSVICSLSGLILNIGDHWEGLLAFVWDASAGLDVPTRPLIRSR